MPGIKDEFNRNWRVQKEEPPKPAVATTNTLDKPRTSKDSSGVVVEGIDNCLIKWHAAVLLSPVRKLSALSIVEQGLQFTERTV